MNERFRIENLIEKAGLRIKKQSGPSRYSYSGSDFNIWMYYPIPIASSNKSIKDEIAAIKRNITLDLPIQEMRDRWKRIEELTAQLDLGDGGIISIGNMQTITTSFASSVSAVETVGSSLPVGFTRGQKTYAGTTVFTILDKEPLQRLIDLTDPSSNPDKDRASDFFSIDQTPEFNIVIEGTNELPGPGGVPKTLIKVIVGVKLMTHGETISIDDFFLEQQYQYVARYITPWIEIDNAPGARNKALSTLGNFITVTDEHNTYSNTDKAVHVSSKKKYPLESKKVASSIKKRLIVPSSVDLDQFQSLKGQALDLERRSSVGSTIAPPQTMIKPASINNIYSNSSPAEKALLKHFSVEDRLKILIKKSYMLKDGTTKDQRRGNFG
jgi:hypothetical protein